MSKELIAEDFLFEYYEGRESVSDLTDDEVFEVMEEYAKKKDNRIKELEKMVKEAVELPKGIEPHSWSDYKKEK